MVEVEHCTLDLKVVRVLPQIGANLTFEGCHGCQAVSQKGISNHNNCAQKIPIILKRVNMSPTKILTTAHLAEHVEEEPVAHLALLDDGVDDLPLDQPEADVEKVGAHSRAQNDDGAVEHHQRRQRPQNQKPGTNWSF